MAGMMAEELWLKELNVQDNRTNGDLCGDLWGILQMRIGSNADGSCATESHEFWP